MFRKQNKKEAASWSSSANIRQIIIFCPIIFSYPAIMTTGVIAGNQSISCCPPDNKLGQRGLMMQPKIAIFLGAGFSKAADLPIMDKFAEYSKTELRNIEQRHGPGSQSPRNAAPLLIENGKLYESFRQYLNNMAPIRLSSFSADKTPIALAPRM